MKLLIIGNPIAGGGRAGQRIAELVQHLERAGHAVEVRLTAAAGDGRRFAAALPADVQRLIVAGGDGTLHEVLNGLADPAAVPIVQLPAGTANVLVRELELPWRPDEVAALVETGRIRRLDMGQVSGPHGADGRPLRRRFILLVSCGFDAMVIEDIARHRTGRLGARGYLMPLLRTMWRYRQPALTVTIDGGQPHHAAMAVVSNTKNYAALFTVADRAAVDSGVFDICMLPRLTVPGLLWYAWHARRGRLSSLPEVTYLHGRTVRIESDPPMPIEADGEHLGRTPVDITIHPATVPLVVPQA